MNTGMQDAVNLAWKLALVTHAQASTALLDSYSPERSAVGDMVLRNASRLTDLATLANPAAQAARNVALRVLLGFHTIQDRMATTMSELEIAYTASPLSDGPRAGARWAPENYHGAAPGSGDDPRFVLYAADREKGASLATQFPSLLEPKPRIAQEPSNLVIVRPDGYIGFSSAEAAWDDAEQYLQRLAPTGA